MEIHKKRTFVFRFCVSAYQNIYQAYPWRGRRYSNTGNPRSDFVGTEAIGEDIAIDREWRNAKLRVRYRHLVEFEDTLERIYPWDGHRSTATVTQATWSVAVPLVERRKGDQERPRRAAVLGWKGSPGRLWQSLVLFSQCGHSTKASSARRHRRLIRTRIRRSTTKMPWSATCWCNS